MSERVGSGLESWFGKAKAVAVVEDDDAAAPAEDSSIPI
jgi:hypothetical protein